MNTYSKSCSRLAACLVFCAALPAPAALSDYPFKLFAATEDGETRLYAHNQGHSPVTVHVTTSDAPATSPLGTHTVLLVQPHARIALGDVDDVYAVEYSYYVGRIDAAADAHRCYGLPFVDGYAFPITQAYGSRLTSHNNVQNRYAVDFAMPEGTPIVAARAGVVIDVTLDHQAGGVDPDFLYKANTLTIVHDDGTVAEYAHLAPRPPLVRPGQRVEEGSRIAYSGNTGYSTAPHLHFVVSKPGLVDGKILPVSVPFRFCANNALTVRATGSAKSPR